MADLLIRGGVPLRGVVRPSANKNAVLPILCATLLTDQPVLLRHVPDMVAISIDRPSRIRNAQPIKRAHPNFIANLRTLGANIEWTEAM